jgi:outer membrane protein assembly factor BamB
LKDVLRSPPVGPIAQALASMKDASAAPLLADHLFDPADTDDDILQAAKALAILGGPSQLPTWKEFFSVYHASAETPEISSAVVSVGESLLRFGGKDGRALVDHAIADPNTVPEIIGKLQGLEQAADANAQQSK